MASRRYKHELSAKERRKLAKLAEHGLSDRELLHALWDMIPAGQRSAVRFAELLHREFGVPRRLTESWAELDPERYAWSDAGPLADVCWRYIHTSLRGLEPRRTIDSVPEDKLERSARKVRGFATGTPVRDRRVFERSLLDAYSIAGLERPQVIWNRGIGSALLIVTLCHSVARKGRSADASRRAIFKRFEALRAGISPTCRIDHMVVEVERALARILTEEQLEDPDTILRPWFLGKDEGQRIRRYLFDHGLRRLDPVLSTRITTRAEHDIRNALSRLTRAEEDHLVEMTVETMVEACAEVGAWGGNFARYLRNRPGTWWYHDFGDAEVVRFARDRGVDPVPSLAHVHDVAYGLARHGYWSFCGHNVAVLCEAPVSAHWNDDGLLSSSEHPALEFSDGFKLYSVDGFRVPEMLVERPEELRFFHIEDEQNAEIRRIMIEVFGPGRYLEEAGAEIVDMDMVDVVPGDSRFGSMPRVLMRDRDGQRWLVGTDGSTRRVYHMRVPRDVETCAQAHNELAGFDESDIVASS